VILRGALDDNEHRVADDAHERGGVAEDQLAALFERVERHFYRPEVKKRARQYLAGLMAPIERKTARAIAGYSGELASDSIERFLTTAKWSVDGLMVDLRNVVVEAIGDPSGILVITCVCFPKKGTKSVGVIPDGDKKGLGYQKALFLGYVTPHGCAFLDRRLYLERTWIQNHRKNKSLLLPESVQPSDSGILAEQMLTEAACVPHTWVVFDDPYACTPDLSSLLQRQRQPFIEGLSRWWESKERMLRERDSWCVQPEQIHVDDDWWDAGRQLWWTALPIDQPYDGFIRWFLKRETKLRYLLGSDNRFVPTDCSPDYANKSGEWFWELDKEDNEWKWNLHNPEYYEALAPKGVHLQELVKVINASQQVAQAMHIARNVVGLDHYEARSWPAWHRHTALALLAYAHLLRPARQRGQRRVKS